MDLNFADGLFLAQAEIDAAVAGREITACGRDHGVLHFPLTTCEPQLGTNSGAIALGAAQVESDPVIPIASLVAEEVCGSVQIADDNIDVAVVIEIAKSSTTSGPRALKDITCGRGDVDELVLCILQEQRRLQRAQMRLRDFDVVHHMRVGDEDFLGSVVIVVEGLNTPAAIGPRGPGETCAYGRVVELSFAEVMK